MSQMLVLPVPQHIPLPTLITPTYPPREPARGLSRSPGHLTLVCLVPWPLVWNGPRPSGEGKGDTTGKPRVWGTRLHESASGAKLSEGPEPLLLRGS